MHHRAKFHGPRAKLNNSVIRGTNTVFRKFKRNYYGGPYAHLHACDSRGTFLPFLPLPFLPQCFRRAATIATTIGMKAFTIAMMKANGAENCEEFARTKKN